MKFYQAFSALSFFILFTTGNAGRDLANDEQCRLDYVTTALAVALLAIADPEGYKESVEETCNELDGKVVEVSVEYSDETCASDLGEDVPTFYCIPGSCGSDAKEALTNLLEASPEGDDDCMDFEWTIVGDDTSGAAGAQSQYFSSLRFFLIQGVIASSFMVAML